MASTRTYGGPDNLGVGFALVVTLPLWFLAGCYWSVFAGTALAAGGALVAALVELALSWQPVMHPAVVRPAA